MPNTKQPRTLIFDFVNKKVVVVGTTPETDQQYRDFVAQQQVQPLPAVRTS